MSGLAILGVGTHLPPQIRRNDWWDESIVASWRAPRAPSPSGKRAEPEPDLTEGARLALEALRQSGDDPFRGAVERRVLADDLNSSDMEADAAKKALDAAGVEPGEIDFLLVSSVVPDFAGPMNAGLIHRRLGLPRDCFMTNIEAACNGFLLQLTLADSLVRSGRFRRGLLVQSAIGSRVTLREDSLSPLFGDGASAVVVGAVPEARLLGYENRADGARHGSLVIGNEGGRWIDAGRPHMYVYDPAIARAMLLAIADRCRDSVNAVLERVGWSRESVSFYACHQPSPWFRPVTQKYCGLEHARWFGRFEEIGSLSGANIPFVLHGASETGKLRSGDRVVMFAGGAGETWSSAALVWGGA